MIGDVAQACVTGRQLGPGVADPNDGPAVEGILGQALALHPAAMNEAVLVLGAVAPAAAERFFLFAHLYD